MEIRALGPLDAREGDRAVPLGGPRQRAVLALLLLRAGELVSSERLIDDLWGGRPPASAASTLHVYVSRLRKVLPMGTLVSEGRGYRLAVREVDIDARRFERLVDEGRRARTAGDAEQAAALLREALGLWRGPALADFAYEPFAQGEIARLEELRLAALEERIDADLALGRHAEVAAELDGLIAAHPLRERLRGQLMLARYRCGRQAEALEAYHDARRVLVEQLGIEPSPALRELERAILEQDPALQPAPPPITPLARSPAPVLEPSAVQAGEPIAPEAPARRIVTVLFADVVDSSALFHRLDPERLERVMDRFFATASEAVARHGGTIEKYIGDAFMAVFGAPRIHEDDAARALRAALDLREDVAALNDELRRDWGVRIALRTGINTGEVVTGDAASRRLVTGEAVVVAERLQAAGEPGEILVGERTATAARGAFEFSEPLAVEAKGSEVGIPARWLVRALSWERPRGVPAGAGVGLQRVFVGRTGELELLALTHARVVRSDEPHLVAILGEPGIGKTTLVGALRERLGEGVDWYVGRCVSYGRAATYRPLAEILRQRLGLREGDPADVVRERLADVPILGLTLGLGPGEQELHPLEARRRMQEAWVELLEEVAAEGPAVVVVEDLHWAEDALLELLDQLARHMAGPLLLIVTARPELIGRRPDWAAAANASQLRLEPLSKVEAATMLRELAGELPDRVRELVLDRAEGNPFFIEEALASLLDRGVLRATAGAWTVADIPADLPMPDSVQAMLAARVDLLPASDRQALQAAAVIGRSFWEGAVRELTDGQCPDLELLVERGFVRRQRQSSLAGERELVFKHALTRAVTYASLPLARRARLHARAAGWLERTGAAADEHASLLAHHYAEAAAPAVADLAWKGEGERAAELRSSAVRWLRRAAEIAVGRYEIDQALALLHEALALEPDDGTRIELWLAAADACKFRYDTDGFRGALERALALEPPSALSADIYAQLANAGSGPWLWRNPPPSALVERWTDRALELAEPGTPALAQALIARARTHPERELEAAREAVALAERLGDPTLLAAACDARADVATAAGALDEARQWVDRGLAMGRAIHNPYYREGQLLEATFAYLRAGLIDQARKIAAEHDAIATRLTPHQEVHAVAVDLLVETLAGDWQAACALTARAEAASAANRDTPCQFNWRALLMAALAQAHAGDEPHARRLEQLASQAIEVGGPATREPALLRLALLRGDREAIERLLTENPGAAKKWDVDYAAARLDALAALGYRDAVEREAPPELMLGGYGKPFALRALGIVRGDRTLIEQAAGAFESLGLAYRAQETQAAVRMVGTPLNPDGATVWLHTK